MTSGMKHCESANCLELNPNQQGRLIHVSGNTETDRLIVDSQFGLSEANCIKLIRNVEMYQWVETTHTSKKKTTYKYLKEWRDTFQNSNGFRHTGYDNYQSNWIIEKTVNVNPSVKLGVFELSETLKVQSKKQQLTQINQNNIDICRQYYSKYDITLEHSYIYVRHVRNQDSLGDLRIQFKSVLTGPTTVVARQLNNDLVPFSFQNTLGKQYSIIQEELEESEGCCDCIRKLEEPMQNIEWLFEEVLTRKQAFKQKLEDEWVTTQAIRFLGWLMMVIGICAVFYPVGLILSYVPLFGGFLAQITSASFALLSIAISTPMALIVISFAWVFYRPLVGAMLFLSAMIILAMSKLYFVKD